MRGYTFGQAIDMMRGDSSLRMAREGWNGRGMWVAWSPGCAGLPAASFWSVGARKYAEELGGAAKVLPCWIMRTASGEILMGWLASQTDMNADDWTVVHD
jgi:hypothetical protein